MFRLARTGRAVWDFNLTLELVAGLNIVELDVRVPASFCAQQGLALDGWHDDRMSLAYLLENIIIRVNRCGTISCGV
jgi:hypothetical protein